MQAGGHGRDDLLVNFLDGVFAFDEDNAVWFAESDLAVFCPDSCVEGVLLRLEAIFILPGLGLNTLVAAAGAGKRGLQAGQKEEGQIRLEVAAKEAVQSKHGLGAKLTAPALVGLSGVGKAVAEDDFALVKGGLDDFGNGLGAVGEHQGHFRHGREAGGAGVEDERADAVAGDCATGLTGEDGFDQFPGPQMRGTGGTRFRRRELCLFIPRT